jgi:hypothetical protein
MDTRPAPGAVIRRGEQGDAMPTVNELVELLRALTGRVKVVESWQETWEREANERYRNLTEQIAATREDITSMQTQVAVVQQDVETIRRDQAAFVHAQMTPESVEAAVGRVLDARQVMEHANRYRALTGGARALGWRMALAAAGVLGASVGGALLAAAWWLS